MVQLPNSMGYHTQLHSNHHTPSHRFNQVKGLLYPILSQSTTKPIPEQKKRTQAPIPIKMYSRLGLAFLRGVGNRMTSCSEYEMEGNVNEDISLGPGFGVNFLFSRLLGRNQ